MQKKNLPIYVLSASLIWVGVASTSQAQGALKGPLTLAKIQAEVVALQAQEKALQTQENSLQKQETSFVGVEKTRFAAVENRVVRIETVLKLKK